MPQPPHRPSDASRRPSLLAPGAAKARAADDEPSGFGLSILSAARDDFRPSVQRSAGTRKPAASARRGTALWLLGTALAAAGLVGLAQWQRGQTPVPAPAAAMATVAPPASASAPPAQAAAASAPELRVAEAVEGAASASAPEAPGAGLRQLVARPPAPAKPAARAPSTDTRKPKDPDTELVAAVMAHTDAARRNTLQPLSELQRLHFSGELRNCRSGATVTARDACVVAACEARGYWGRTKSCPLPPAPPKAVADGKARVAKPPSPQGQGKG